jgi:hypothetical protein
LLKEILNALDEVEKPKFEKHIQDTYTIMQEESTGHVVPGNIQQIENFLGDEAIHLVKDYFS